MKDCNEILSHKPIDVDEIPTIDLYMDQVTGYMDTALKKLIVSDEDKILTKTMINNYVKAKVIEKPQKKKYNNHQIMDLIMIYHLKNIISIGEIDELLKLQRGLVEDDCDESVIYKQFTDIQNDVFDEMKTKFDEKCLELDNLNEAEQKESIIEIVTKLVLQADLNKRLAEIMLRNLNGLPRE